MSAGHWIVRKSTNGGMTWTTVDNAQLQTKADSIPAAFARDSGGNLFVVGYGKMRNSIKTHWVVRKNAGGTGAWEPSEVYQLAAGQDAKATGIAADGSGNVFVGGHGTDASGASHWLVRRSPPLTASATSATFSSQTISADGDEEARLIDEVLA